METGEAPGGEHVVDWTEARATLLEESVHGRAREAVLADELERQRRRVLQTREVEAVGKLARGRLEIAAGDRGLAKLHLDLRHPEEGRSLTIVIGEQSRKEVAGGTERIRIALRERGVDARIERLVELLEHRELIVRDRVTEVGELVGRVGRRRRGLRPAGRLDHVIGGEHGLHRPRLVDGDVRDMEIARRRREHDRDDPCVARDAANAADIAHVEETTEVGPQRRGYLLPDFLAGHFTSIRALASPLHGTRHDRPRDARPRRCRTTGAFSRDPSRGSARRPLLRGRTLGPVPIPVGLRSRRETRSGTGTGTGTGTWRETRRDVSRRDETRRDETRVSVAGAIADNQTRIGPKRGHAPRPRTPRYLRGCAGFRRVRERGHRTVAAWAKPSRRSADARLHLDRAEFWRRAQASSRSRTSDATTSRHAGRRPSRPHCSTFACDSGS